MTDLSIVYVHYNTPFDLARSLASLEGALGGMVPEVLVVDNASNPPLDLPPSRFRIRLLVSPENVGFARAANVGVRAAASQLVLLVNPDVIFTEGSIRDLVELMNGEADIGLLAPQAFYEDGSPQPTARRIPTLRYLLFGRRSLVSRLLPNNYMTRAFLYTGIENSAVPVDVQAVIGACVLLRKRAFEEVGGFDERFFFYAEDMDLSHRLWKHGFRVTLDPRVHVVHLYGRARRLRALFSEYQRMKAFYRLFLKNSWRARLVGPLLALSLAAFVGALFFRSLFDSGAKERSWVSKCR